MFTGKFDVLGQNIDVYYKKDDVLVQDFDVY